MIDIDGVYYYVGGLLTDMPRGYLNRTALAENVTFDPNAFHFVSYRTLKPEAPFKYKPRRGAPDDIVWPPRGLRLDVTFKAPFWAPRYHQVKFFLAVLLLLNAFIIGVLAWALQNLLRTY